jgi:twitching motility protein PilT
MTQSKENPGKQPFPVPPSVPATRFQAKTQIDDEVTQANLSNSIPTAVNKKAGQSPPFPAPPVAPNANRPANFELEQDKDDPEITQVTTPEVMPSRTTRTTNIPPLPPLSLTSPISTPRTRPETTEERSLLKTPTTMPVGGQMGQLGKRPMQTPPGPPKEKSSFRPAPETVSPTPLMGRAPGQPPLEELVKLAFNSGYSDIHLGVGEQVRMRDRGEILILKQYPQIDLHTFMSWLREILSEEDIQKFKKELEYDGAARYDFARVRINVFDSLRGPALVLRLIPLQIATIEQLRLPLVLKDVSDAPKGLVLVTGPTGSGKSTTLAAMVDYINNEHSKHIITIEDPIEFVHASRKCLIKQREVGMHTLEFDNALKASLREDPDVVLVGEMRDKETVNTALKAAQTGHLVMGTLHTNSAVKTLERILTLYSAEEQPAMRVAIAEALVAIISQGLCRTTDGKRAAYHDILVNTEAVKDYIYQGKYDEILELMKHGEYHGMITMNQSIFNLYQEGRITEETALENSPTPNEMAMMLRGKID